MPTKSKQPAPVTAKDTTSEALRVILKHNFNYLVQWEDTARSWSRQ